MALVTLRPYPCPWAQCVETSWHSLYGGEGKDTLQVWGWALFMGDKKSKPWEISSQVSYLDQHILVHLGQITSTSSLFRAGKKYFFFFFRNAQLTPACFLSSERRCCGGCIKELDISLSSSSSGTGYSSAVADLLSKLHVYQKKKKFLKTGAKILAF